MKKPVNAFKKLAFFILCFFLAGICNAPSTSATGAEDKIIVVASTSWTGAIAEAAGADEVRVLAPFELKHPLNMTTGRRISLGCVLRVCSFMAVMNHL